MSKASVGRGQFVARKDLLFTRFECGNIIKLQAEWILLALELKESTRPICISGSKVANIMVGGEMKPIICQRR